MKVAFIHPLKHHIYHSMNGALKSGDEVIGLFGYFYKNDLIDKVLKKTKYSPLVDGYYDDKIASFVKTNCFVKIFFLLNKACPRIFGKIFEDIYYKWVIKNLHDVDCIHVLQDYENKIIRYAHNHGIKIIYEQIIAFDVDRYLGKQTSYTSGKLYYEIENLKMSDAIIAASSFVKDSIIDRIDDKSLENKIFVIPYGADVSIKERKNSLNNDGKLNVITVCSITERKGIKEIIEAFHMLEKENIVLTLIGTIMQDGNEYIDEIKGMNNINYIGTVPHSNIFDYYKNNNVYLLPSYCEGSSLSVYEAMSCSLPCVVTKNCGSVIEDGIDGKIIPAGDPKAIAKALIEFLKNPDLISAFGKKAYDKCKIYSWDRFELKISELYQNIK